METNTVKFNATGRYWVLNNYPENHPIRDKVANKRIMDRVELNELELKSLYYDLKQYNVKDIHLANTKSRVQYAINELE